MINRRQLLTTLTSTGIGTAVFHKAVVALAQDDEDKLNAEMLQQAEWVSGIELTDEQRDEIVDAVARDVDQIEKLREIELTADVGPALHFHTISAEKKLDSVERVSQTISTTVRVLPESDEEIAFLPVHELSWLIRTGKISSVDLTKIYIDRLKKYSPMLRCMVTLTEELAMEQAERADRELQQGIYRSPLHGIPWGAKDLISVPGYPTTWGIPHYKDRVLDDTATVAARLEEAGAVLIAKLSLGALAMGDMWFEGMTRNPWNPRVGSSGSSAGSASAVVAGLVGFTLGSETLGSILSPSIRCGSTGMRPTFGRVSRYGCMPLSWSMDKIGPICRSVEDCALVFDAIHGADGRDLTANNYAFSWPTDLNVSGLRVGVLKLPEDTDEESGGGETDSPEDGGNEKEIDPLAILQEMGCELVEIELPSEFSYYSLTNVISVEGASVFDQLLRDGHTEGWNAWDGIFRSAQYISAIDYLRYQRLRTKLMHDFEASIKDVDFLCNMNDLVHTNLTGHPSVVMPLRYRDSRQGGKRIVPVVFTGHLNDDARLLSLSHAFQQRIDAHLQAPPLDEWLGKFDAGELDEKEDEDE
ncbi:MAG: amidase [Planctomycetota bacterium]